MGIVGGIFFWAIVKGIIGGIIIRMGMMGRGWIIISFGMGMMGRWLMVRGGIILYIIGIIFLIGIIVFVIVVIVVIRGGVGFLGGIVVSGGMGMGWFGVGVSGGSVMVLGMGFGVGFCFFIVIGMVIVGIIVIIF